MSEARLKSGKMHIEIELVESIGSGVQVSSKVTPYGMILKTSLHPEFTSLDRVFDFAIHIEGDYPSQAPKLLLESAMRFPSPSDGRDLLEEALKQRWESHLTSLDVLNSLPVLLAELQTTSREMGKFHLGSPYYLDNWEYKDGMGLFHCKEGNKDLAFVVTHAYILQLDYSTECQGVGFLKSWATLQSLDSIRKSKTHQDNVTFLWKPVDQTPAHSQHIVMQNCGACISLISINMKRLGATVKKTGTSLKEDEVTAKSLESVNIEEILQAITIYESNMEFNLNIEMINSLMSLYQKAIEYYSAMSDPMYDSLLMRMQNLLANETIQGFLLVERDIQVNPHDPGEFIATGEDEEAKEEIKEEDLLAVKEDAKEPAKEDVKEPVKEDVKEDVKEEIKEENEVIQTDVKEIEEPPKDDNLIMEPKEEIPEVAENKIEEKKEEESPAQKAPILKESDEDSS